MDSRWSVKTKQKISYGQVQNEEKGHLTENTNLVFLKI